MAPWLRPGDVVVVWQPARPRPAEGTVVVVALPGRPSAVKRLVLRAPDGTVWVEGDNRAASTDSRSLGWLPPAAVRGRVLARYRPGGGVSLPRSSA